MKRALLPCVAIAAMVTGCGDDGSAPPDASIRVGAPVVEESITVAVTAADASVAVSGKSAYESMDAPEYPEGSGGTTPSAYVDVDVPPGLGTDGFVGAREDVQLDRCELDGDHWVAAGVVTNTSGAGAAYRIYVAFNPKDSPAARGLVQVDFLIPEGESQAWHAVAWITDPDLECVLRVERISG